MLETMEEAPELLPATRSPHGYFAVPISENLSIVEEDGYIIAVGVPVARTGFQKYACSDLPQEKAIDLGIDVSNPSATIDLYRPASEVFNPEFLSSLNGKPVVDGHPPDGVFVNKDNFSKYSRGHVQNVRKGLEPLEDGEWPIIADLVISGEPLVGKVLNHMAREISLGYDFSIDRDGDKIIQCNMVGNHVAVVPKGRAGDLVRIDDAAPEQVHSQEQPAGEVKTASAEPSEPMYKPIVIPPIPPKENRSVAETKPKKDWLRIFKGKHLIEMARAADADPEAVMEAAEALNEDPPVAQDTVEVPTNTQANEFKSASDVPKTGNGGQPFVPHSDVDDRARKHAALDRMLDMEEEEGAMDKKRKAKDADIEELKTLLDEFLGEEAKEPEHMEDEPMADPAELESVLAGGGEDCATCGMAMDDEGNCPECGPAMDDLADPGQEMVESGEEELVGDEEGESPDPDSDDDQMDVEDRKRAADRAIKAARAKATDAAAGARAVLKMLRPVVARTGDKAVQAAWNRAAGSVTKASRVSSGSYGGFASAARARDGAPRNPNPDRTRARAADAGNDSIAKMQAFYDAALKGGK